MASQSLLRLSIARANTLAACLAAALASGNVGAAGAALRPADTQPSHASPRLASFGSLPNPLTAGGLNSARDVSAGPILGRPTRPTITIVDTCADDGSAGSLRKVIANAQPNDVVDLSTLTCSPITLVTGAIVATVPGLTLQGPGHELLIVDGDASSLVLVSKYDLTINDLTIANGSYASGLGGCVFVVGDLTLTRSTVTACVSGDGTNPQGKGGGVYVGGNLLMQASIIGANYARASDYVYGGGAYVGGSAQLLDHSEIGGNSAYSVSNAARGGGLFAIGDATIAEGSGLTTNQVRSHNGVAYGGGVFAANVPVIDGTVRGNTAKSETDLGSGGGGISAGSVLLQRSTIESNHVDASCYSCPLRGGGVFATGQVIVESSTISDNHVRAASGTIAKAAGGGVATLAPDAAGSIMLVNSTVSGNSAIGGDAGAADFGRGGGIAAIQSPIAAWNSTIAFNQANIGGGAAFNDFGAPASLYSTIVADNQAPDAADIFSNSPIPSTVQGNNNLVMDASILITLPPDTFTEDPDLEPLADNGGPSWTHAISICSPAKDKGSDTLNLGFDQRGEPFLREVSVRTDIGAYEWQSLEQIFGDGFEGCP